MIRIYLSDKLENLLNHEKIEFFTKLDASGEFNPAVTADVFTVVTPIIDRDCDFSFIIKSRSGFSVFHKNEIGIVDF